VTALTPPVATEARARFPVRRDIDGDFTLGELLGAGGVVTSAPPRGPQPHVAEAALRARLWQPSAGPPTAAVIAASARGRASHSSAISSRAVPAVDLELINAFETAPLWEPPVAASTRALTPLAAQAWLALAAHWMAVTSNTGDLRFLNAACKLLGAVWTHHRSAATGDANSSPGWRQPELSDRLGAAGRQLAVLTSGLARRLDSRLVLGTGPSSYTAQLPPPGPGCRYRGAGVELAVLAAAGSASTARFLAVAMPAGLPVAGLCWYRQAGAGATGRPVESSYDSAWYPPEQPAAGTAIPLPPPRQLPQVTAETWQQVAESLRKFGASLVILLGMPIVPAHILEVPPLGVLNAHNGALPHYRGMDAVAWALLNNDPVICTLHMARPAVDTGEILAAAPVPFPPAQTLRGRVKATQLELLLAAAAFAARTGRLPDATPQPPSPGRRFYRLHPHLKRVLDASPYATPSIPRLPEGKAHGFATGPKLHRT
jgi:folate-dependent phosphoribosylglycinamide formyltransferase PurN